MKNTFFKIFGFLSLLMIVPNLYSQVSSSGSETRVNTTTANDQQRAEVAVAPNGDYVVVWQSEDEDGMDNGIYWQMYNAGGTPNGSATKANVTTNYSQKDPDVAIAANGSFVVSWSSQFEDTDGWGVWFALYDNTGTLVLRNRVNDSSADEQIHSCVAMSYDGSFVVGYMDDGQDGDNWGISYQGFSNTGVAQFAEVVPNSTTTGWQGHPDVAMDSAGNYTWVWQDYALDGSDAGVFMQRYDKNDNPVGSETRVNTTTTGNQINPSIEMDNDGNFMIAWSSFAQDGDDYGIVAQIFDNSGSAVGGEIDVNTTTAGPQDWPSVSIGGDNKYMVSWTSWGQDGDKAGVYIQGFLADGTTYGTEQIVNTTTSLYQALPSVSGDEDTDDLVVVWQSGAHHSTSTQDGDGYGVYSQRFSTVDTEDPNAICQNISAYLDGTGNVTITANDIDGGSTDNVGITSYSASTTSFTCSEIGANTVTLTVEDAAGNTDNCTSTVTVLDTVSPTASCQDITVYLDGAGNASITTGDIDNGSSDNCGAVTLAADITAFTCADAGANTVTLTVTDGSANTSTCTSTVTVLDTVSPTASCQDITIYLDGTGNASITTGDIDNGSSDNCGAVILAADITAFTCADAGANTVTLTVTDGSANTSTCTSTVTVLDTVSPTASCQDITIYLDGTGNASITTGDIDNGSSDNCGAVTLAADITAFTCADVGANTVTLTVTDGSTNTSTCAATVTVLDTVSPVASCQDITVYLDGAGNASITTGDIDNGSSDNCGAVTLAADITAFTCADAGANTVTLTVTDGSTNTSTCAATVTVLDTVSPVASCQDITVYLDGSGNASITTGDIDNGSSDNCTTLSLSADITAFTCADVGANTVTLTVTDGSTNTSTCAATVTVLDTVSPVASCQDITVYLDGAGNASITTGDIDNGSSDNCGAVTLTADITAFTCADAGANTVTFTVTDGSTNTSTCAATVTVLDTVSPVASCQDITVYLDGSGNASITTGDIDNGSSDNCTTLSLSADITAFTCADVGANTVTLTVTDGSTNTSTCAATVTVLDTVSPVASCQDITVYLDGSGNAIITTGDIDNGSSDNCGAVTLTADITAFTCADAGANTVTFTVTDGSTNTSTCAATVTVLDTVSPVASCQDITVYLDGSGNASITTGDIDNGSSDNCTTLSLSADITAFTCADVGANTVTLTVTDGSTNTSTCAATVTVLDTVSPVASCQDITVYLDGAGNASITTGDIDNGSSDNCGAVTLAADITAFTCADVGTNTVTLTVTDGSTNTSTCAATVTVLDTISPVVDISSLTDITSDCSVTSLTNPTVTDNCSGSVTVTNDAILPISGDGTTIITWTFDDGNGNTTTAYQNVIIDDVTDPVTPTLANITGECSATASAPTTADACAGTITGTTTDATTYTTQGTHTITWTFDDGNGNSINATQDVVIDDVTDPVTPTLANVTGECTATASTPTTTDACAGTITGTTTDATTYTTQGTHTITWTFDDGNGNSIAATQDVVIADVTDPTINDCPSDISIPTNTANCEAIVTWVAPTASDNCAATISGTHNSGDSFTLGTTTVTYTATDDAGNTSTCSFDVTVTNDIATNPTTTNILCKGDSTGSAILNATGGSGVLSENWGTTNPSALWAGYQVYTVTDENGCMITDSVMITEPSEAISLSAVTTPETIGGNDGTIDLTPVGGTGVYTFDWDNDGTGDFDDTEDLNSLSPGSYSVTVRDQNGCEDTLTVEIGVYLEITFQEGNEENIFEVYPNPFNDFTTIKYSTNKSETVMLSILDIQGKEIIRDISSASRSGIYTYRLSSSSTEITRGIYLVRLIIGDEVKVKRIISLR